MSTDNNDTTNCIEYHKLEGRLSTIGPLVLTSLDWLVL